MCEANDDANTLPRIATPRAPPIWRVVSFIADPSPAFASGREPMIDSVAGTIAVPMPSPRITRAMSTCGYPDDTVIVASNPRPSATAVMPAATRTLLPTRVTNRPASGGATIKTSAIGATRKPACSGVYPSTNCRYCVRKYREPNSAKKTRTIEMFAAVNRGFSKNVTSSIGWSLRSSQIANVARTTSAKPKPTIVCGDVHPCEGASMIAYTRLTSPTIDNTAPTGSSALGWGSFESGTIRRPRISATITTGTFTKKTEPHQKLARSQPPTIGPVAIPRPDTPAQMPIARPRSCAGKTFVRIDRVDGMISAPPTPMSARLAINALDVPENADSVEPARKITRPTASAFLRPYRSDRLPVV